MLSNAHQCSVCGCALDYYDRRAQALKAQSLCSKKCERARRAGRGQRKGKRR